MLIISEVMMMTEEREMMEEWEMIEGWEMMQEIDSASKLKCSVFLWIVFSMITTYKIY